VRAELSRLWLYRLGLSGVNAKYRAVPRSAIVGFDELRETVQSWSGAEGLHETVLMLWQRHGAPSPDLVSAFLHAAAELDQCPVDASHAHIESLLAEVKALGQGGRGAGQSVAPVDPISALANAKRRLLDLWVRACAPPSRVAGALELVELATCLVLRRARQRWSMIVASTTKKGPAC
jgi:hypothetical protein